jgi:serine protease Do
MNRLGISLVGGFLSLVLFSSSAFAQTKRSERPETFLRTTPAIKNLFQPIAAKIQPSIVKVFSNNKQVALGTIVSEDGLIVTKYSELNDKHKVELRDGRLYDAELLGTDEKFDVALLKVDATGLPAVALRTSKESSVGDWVITPTITNDPPMYGVVSVKTKPMNARDYPPAKRSPDSGFLGVGLKDGKGGPMIESVYKDSAAAKAGIQIDDIVIAVGGRKVLDPDAMITQLQRYKANDPIMIKLRRGEEEVEIKATLGRRSAELGAIDRGAFQNGISKELSALNIGFPVALQHDTNLRARDCGGPLVAMDGKVIGINISSAGRVDSYAIPSEVIESLLPNLKSGKSLDPTAVKSESK